MRTAREWIKDEIGIEMPTGDINGKWFAENHLPMVVECTCCGMTMALPSAYVDDNGEVYCRNCAGVE